jgi:hypothetical protein
MGKYCWKLGVRVKDNRGFSSSLVTDLLPTQVSMNLPYISTPSRAICMLIPVLLCRSLSVLMKSKSNTSGTDICFRIVKNHNSVLLQECADTLSSAISEHRLKSGRQMLVGFTTISIETKVAINELRTTIHETRFLLQNPHRQGGKKDCNHELLFLISQTWQYAVRICFESARKFVVNDFKPTACDTTTINTTTINTTINTTIKWIWHILDIQFPYHVLWTNRLWI